MKAESRQIPQKLAARLKFAYCLIHDIFTLPSLKMEMDCLFVLKFYQLLYVKNHVSLIHLKLKNSCVFVL